MKLSRVITVGMVFSFAACLGQSSDRLVQGLGEACVQSSDCAAGLECEVEHGVGTCQPHRSGGNGGTSDGGSRADASPGTGTTSDASPAGGGAAGARCTVDRDCAAGLECEVEHGVGTCQPHGRRR